MLHLYRPDRPLSGCDWFYIADQHGRMVDAFDDAGSVNAFMVVRDLVMGRSEPCGRAVGTPLVLGGRPPGLAGSSLAN